MAPFLGDGLSKPHEMRRLQLQKTTALDPSSTSLIEDPVHMVKDDREGDSSLCSE